MSEGMTYRDAGVDIDEAQRALRAVAGAIRQTHTDRVIGGIGGFGALLRADFGGMELPVLVSSIDGVGTKTKVATMVGDFSGLGHDIVNHSANDILCQGARPLYFLDYFGCSHLSAPVFEAVVGGAAEACQRLGMALIGGETAEMPGVYHDDEVDIVGTIVGVVDYPKRLPRPEIEAGNLVIGLASDGLHTNGFSLARRALFEVAGYSVRDDMPDRSGTIGEALLRPHRAYGPAMLPLLEDGAPIFGLAHITGGGLYDNIPRVLPDNVRVLIEKRTWTPPAIFGLIQDAGQVNDVDMYRTFNMGIGMVAIVERSAADDIVARLHAAGENAHVIGEVQTGPHDVQIL
ncbi:MAG: phosphoribosylformylglycinamidine cyclo-ligase [Fimbriimonadaceae bacterium]|nr:phosphoribosylformylglycinamidine cyclo-ligase [Fimbriimonadaceae bacterium]